MTHSAIYAFVDDTRQAHDIVHELKRIGFPITEISVVMPVSDAAKDEKQEDGATSPSRSTVAGAATGGVVGGVVGWLAGAGALAIPGVGVLIAAGPALAALTGAAAGTFSGALVAAGLSATDASHSAEQLQNGRILISVAAATHEEREAVDAVFNKHGAEFGGVRRSA